MVGSSFFWIQRQLSVVKLILDLFYIFLCAFFHFGPCFPREQYSCIISKTYNMARWSYREYSIYACRTILVLRLCHVVHHMLSLLIHFGCCQFSQLAFYLWGKMETTLMVSLSPLHSQDTSTRSNALDKSMNTTTVGFPLPRAPFNVLITFLLYHVWIFLSWI